MLKDTFIDIYCGPKSYKSDLNKFQPKSSEEELLKNYYDRITYMLAEGLHGSLTDQDYKQWAKLLDDILEKLGVR